VATKQNVPFWKLLQGTRFIVDGFHYADRSFHSSSSSSASPHVFFLSHFHSDHYTGLTRHFSSGKIYCTKVTARLLASRFGLRGCVEGMPLNKPFTVDDAEVTFLDANHCPGSAMILFELQKSRRKYLHVGDFRYTSEMRLYPKLKELKERELDIIYLDTTYCDPKRDFPSQKFCIDYVARHCEVALRSKKTLVCIGAYSIGKERVQLGIVSRCKTKIYVDSTRYKTYAQLDLPFSTLDFSKCKTPKPSLFGPSTAKNQQADADKEGGGFLIGDSSELHAGNEEASEDTLLGERPKKYEGMGRLDVEMQDDLEEALLGLDFEGNTSDNRGTEECRNWNTPSLFPTLSKERMKEIEKKESMNKHLLSSDDEDEKAIAQESPQDKSQQRGTTGSTKLKPRNITDVYTTNPRCSNVHVVPMGWLNKSRLETYAASVGRFSNIVAFRPTGWSGNRPKCIRKGKVTMHHVPYSEHSTFNELREFIRWLKPKRIIPTVNGKEWKAILRHFEDCLH